MSRTSHTHKCSRCKQPFECDGYEWQNHDGFPEAVCRSFHEQGIDECDVCTSTMWCGNCGGHPVTATGDFCAACLAAGETAQIGGAR